jgi:hypothetical protein
MSVDSVLQQARPFVQLVGTILITIAALKLAGVNIDLVRGEFWQIAVVGLALKSW